MARRIALTSIQVNDTAKNSSVLLGDREIHPGDEVMTAAAGFPAVNPILQHGCVPVFLDITLPSYQNRHHAAADTVRQFVPIQ
jgi:dTDP-4-amino-4,6-dideoxygalactose transaminase